MQKTNAKLNLAPDKSAVNTVFVILFNLAYIYSVPRFILGLPSNKIVSPKSNHSNVSYILGIFYLISFIFIRSYTG